MNKLINDFIEYLYNIGILSNDSLGKFSAVNSFRNDNLNVEESFVEQMKKSLVNFIFGLNNEQKFVFTENIVKKFLIRNQLEKIKKLKESILIMSRIKSYDLKYYLLLWKKTIKKKGIPFSIKRIPIKNIKISSNKKNITKPKIIKNTILYNNKNKYINNHLLSENNIKTKKLLSELKTRNNHLLTENNYSNNITENILNSNKSSSNIKDKQKNINLNRQSSNKSFKTETSNTNKSLIEFIPINNKIYFNYKKEKKIYHPLKESFYERQNSLLKRRKEYIKNKSFDKELNISNSCTFIPELNEISHNLAHSHSFTPTHIRLYNDFQYRVITYNNAQLKENNRIKKEANRNLYKIDPLKIEQLYNEYKEKKLFKKNLQKKYDLDNGITYQPFIHHDKYHNRINSTFMEREKNYIYEKEVNLTNYNKEFKNNQICNLVGYEKWKNKNRNNIVNNVLDRLYINETTSKKLKKRNKIIRKSSFETCSSSFKKKIGNSPSSQTNNNNN